MIFQHRSPVNFFPDILDDSEFVAQEADLNMTEQTVLKLFLPDRKIRENLFPGKILIPL